MKMGGNKEQTAPPSKVFTGLVNHNLKCVACLPTTTLVGKSLKQNVYCIHVWLCDTMKLTQCEDFLKFFLFIDYELHYCAHTTCTLLVLSEVTLLDDSKITLTYLPFG